MSCAQRLFSVSCSLSVVSTSLFSVIYADICLSKDKLVHGQCRQHSDSSAVTYSSLFSCAAASSSFMICRPFNFGKPAKPCNLNKDADSTSPGQMIVSSNFIYSDIEMWSETALGFCGRLICMEKRCLVGGNVGQECVTRLSFGVSYRFVFEFINTPLSHDKAVRECSKKNGQLATVHTATKHKRIIELLKDKGVTWLGASDADEEGVWVWVDGKKMVFESWSEDQPDNYRPGQDCMVFKPSESSWYDRRCTDSYTSVCETVVLT